VPIHSINGGLYRRVQVRATIELEPNFRLPFKWATWIYPILRYHQQSGSDFYGLPGSFNAQNNFYTADRDHCMWKDWDKRLDAKRKTGSPMDSLFKCSDRSSLEDVVSAVFASSYF